MKHKVTVGLCVRNAEDTVKAALGSILNQDFSRELLELIVVDGNSRDRTVAIIKHILSKNVIQYRLFHENEGLGFARQIVVDNARGDYIIWVDGDLILPKDYVKKLVAFMEQNPMVGIAGGKFGNFPGRTLAATLENIMYVVNSHLQNPKTTSKLLSRKNEQHRYVGAEGSIYRVNAIRQVGGFDTNIKGAGEDVDVTYRIGKENWRVSKTDAVFYESCREDWKTLWSQYYWYGYGGHYLAHKDRRLIPIYEMLPPMGFLAGLLNSLIAYRITGKKISFLLPLQYAFKRIAWCYGFLGGHVAGYGHPQQTRAAIVQQGRVMPKLSRSFLIKAMAIPVGYLLSFISVFLPWRARNKYLELLGFLIGEALHSKMVVDFFIKIGFKELETKPH